jgi:hypothetical protein
LWEEKLPQCCALPAHLIEDDTDDISTSTNEPNPDATDADTTQRAPDNPTHNLPDTTPITQTPMTIPHHDGEIDDDKQFGRDLTPTQELLMWHYRLGHLPFKRLQQMARQGILPARLGTCRIPECAACRFARATKVPWRTKGSQPKLCTVTAPGQCIAVDQLDASTPGLIAQLKGIPTKQRYRYATVFVDHFSRHSFVYLHKRITSEETVAAKKAYEAFAKLHHVSIRHYHADNGRFADNAFLKAIVDQQQTISY